MSPTSRGTDRFNHRRERAILKPHLGPHFQSSRGTSKRLPQITISPEQEELYRAPGLCSDAPEPGGKDLRLVDDETVPRRQELGQVAENPVLDPLFPAVQHHQLGLISLSRWIQSDRRRREIVVVVGKLRAEVGRFGNIQAEVYLREMIFRISVARILRTTQVTTGK